MQIVRHRGARMDAPENTVPGFIHAVRFGLDAVDFDVRRSRDGQLVVIHDATVDRTTDRMGDVGDFTAELSDMYTRADHPEWPERRGIPTLDEVLDVVGHPPRILMEIKAGEVDGLEAVTAGVLEQIRSLGIADRVTVTSFEPTALDIVGRLAPDQSRGLIGDGAPPVFLDAAQRLGCDQIDVRLATTAKALIDAARERGIRTVGWPCNDVDALTTSIAWRPDIVTTDRPSWLLSMPSNSST